MATEEDEQVDQASNARSERLKALRAAKQLSATADDEPASNGLEADGPVDDQREEKKNVGAEEVSVEPAAERRDRLKALRMAKELSETPDDNTKTKESKETPDENTKIKESETTDDTTKITEPEQINEEKQNMGGGEDFVEQAVARRDGLKVLRMAKELSETPDDNVNTKESEEIEEDDKLNMKFRNYLPHDKRLQGSKLASVVVPKFEDPITAVPLPLEKIEDPFVNIAPKKPNWDLRRDVQKKLDKLERRTQKALYQLMQEQEKERQALQLEDGSAD